MSTEISPSPSNQSMEFFTDPNSYTDFSLTRDKKRIIACIDPRFPGCPDSRDHQHPDETKVTIQTDGGAIGLGHDHALSLAAENSLVMPIEQALIIEKRFRIANVLDAHRECKFLNGIVQVLKEEADPSDFTMDAIERWDAHYGLELSNSRAFGKLKDAAARQAEVEAERQDMESLLEVVDELYPHHPNVRYMAGQNRANLHVTTHHPLVGIDRARQARLYGEEAQGYHNNLGAIVERSMVLRDLSPHDRMLRASAAVMRAAATRTVVTAGNPNAQFLEVHADTDNGIVFEEEKAA